MHRAQLWQVFHQGRVLPVDEGVGTVVQLQQLGQRAHAGVVLLQHRRQVARVAPDAAGATHGGEKLEILDAAHPPGSTRSGVYGFLHAAECTFKKKKLQMETSGSLAAAREEALSGLF